MPTTAELRQRYENGMGFSLESDAAKPLLIRYTGGDGTTGNYIRNTRRDTAPGVQRADALIRNWSMSLSVV